MNGISSEKGNVADFPLKLNLQLFADGDDGTPSLEDSAEFETDAREFNAKMDKYVQEREVKTPPAEPDKEKPPVTEEDKADKPEIAEPEPPKPKQDSETNKAFQEMRKAREEAERVAKESSERAKRADALIAEQYGHMGITTVEQYDAALKAEREAENVQRYQESGLTPEEVEWLRTRDEVEPKLKAEQEERAIQESTTQWKKLYDSYPNLLDSAKVFTEGKDPDWYTDEMKAEIARGASPLAAYRNAHFETILQQKMGNTKEIAKQEALDQLNSKEHLAPNATTGGEVDHVEIDGETMRNYRALNKGKTDAQIRAWHKKHAK